MSTTARVLTGLVAGIVIGIPLAWTDPALARPSPTSVEPFGKLWIQCVADDRGAAGAVAE